MYGAWQHPRLHAAWFQITVLRDTIQYREDPMNTSKGELIIEQSITEVRFELCPFKEENAPTAQMLMVQLQLTATKLGRCQKCIGDSDKQLTAL